MQLHALHRSLPEGDEIVARTPLQSALTEVEFGFAFDGGGFACEPTQNMWRLRRLAALADAVDHDLRVLIVGLNPSHAAAAVGYGFAGSSNRFWKAALASGLVSTARDPARAVEVDRVGFTDLVKRPTARAAELDPQEFVAGLARLTWVVAHHQPAVVCVLGITGWRHIAGKDAIMGVQPTRLAQRPVYVMPNPSGLNAHTNHDDVVEHFTTVLDLAANNAADQSAAATPIVHDTPVPPMPQ